MKTRKEARQEISRKRRRTAIANLLVVVGALVLLAPLLFWAQDAWQVRMLKSGIAERPVLMTESGRPASGPAEPEHQPAQVAAADRSQVSGWAYRIQIPAIGVDYLVQPGIEDQHLALGPGHYPQTPQPGEEGNAALAGHRTVKGKASYFYNLHKLKIGDRVRIVYPDRQVEFAIERVFVTDPYDLSVLKSVGGALLTLTTCDPPGTDDNRLIVQARMVQESGRN